ncbi:MAG: metallophosphoesterase [Clostridia bacterium]|nr:metallophosphoesterase [Clostridia bacterium]
MMRILHTSDIHLGSPITAHLDGARAAIRRRELQDGFARLVYRARELSCEGIIIAGDLFDGALISRRLIESTLATVASTPEISFFYLPGNHEGDVLKKSGISLPDNLKLFGEGWTYYELGSVRIGGRTRHEPRMLGGFASGGGVNIAVLHGERREGQSGEGVIGMQDALASCVDYLALGHYHGYSARRIGRCEAVYSGTPEGRGFDEAGDLGFVLIEIEGTTLRHSFLKSGGRRLSIVEADITGDRTQAEVERTVERALLGIPAEDMVRVVLTGEHTASTLRDLESIKRRFSQSYFYFEARDNSRLCLDPEEFAKDPTLRGEFVRLVMADGSLSQEERDRILECGLRALEGESAFGRWS